MPKQLSRIIIAFVIFISLFLVVRHFLVPKSFYQYGHYRGDALKDNEDHVAKYLTSKDCAACHFGIDSLKTAGSHNGLSCQICHGPGNKHIVDPVANKLIKPTERAFCGKCHSKNAARSEKVVKQRDLTKHNPESKCTVCHNPHSPSFGNINSDTTSKGKDKKIDDATCGTCHNQIYTYKLSGVHKNVGCQSCHGLGDKHITGPSANKLKKPVGRDFCGKCHGKGIASASSKTKQVDLNEHNIGMDCKECHKPHSPLDF